MRERINKLLCWTIFCACGPLLFFLGPLHHLRLDAFAKASSTFSQGPESLSSTAGGYQSPRGSFTDGHASSDLYDSDYSFVTCHMDYQNQDDQTCHFRNVCWDRRRSTFVYFVDPDKLNVTIHGLQTLDGTSRRVPLRRKLVDNPGYQNDYFPLEERRMRLPRHMMRLSEHVVHILYSTSIWAENFGHTVVDDMCPLFALMHVFKLVTRDAMILSLHGPAGTVRNQPVELARVEKFTTDFAALLSDVGAHAMDSHVLFSKRGGENQRRQEEEEPTPMSIPDLTCMRNLLVGSGNVENLNPDAYLVGAWTPFIDAILDGWRRGVLLDTPEEVSQFVALQQQQEQSFPLRHLVVFLVKVGRRRITNIDVLARETKKTFKNIEVLLVNPGNMTQHDQITLAQRATVTFAPCGGISFFNAFLREGATAIITDYWDVDLNQSASMEGYFWTHVTRQQTVRYPVLQDEIIPEFGQEINDHNKAEAYRNYGVLTLDIGRALHLIGHALYAGERVFEMK